MDTRKNSESEDKTQERWLTYENNGGNVFVDRKSFEELGLVFTTPDKDDHVNTSGFKFKKSTYYIKDIEEQKSYANKDGQSSPVTSQEPRPNVTAVKRASSLLEKLRQFSNKDASDLSTKKIEFILASKKPKDKQPKFPDNLQSLQPNSFVFIRDEKFQWQAYLVENEQNEPNVVEKGKYKLVAKPFDIAQVDGLEKILNHLPKHIEPENFSDTEKKPISEVLNAYGHQNIFIYNHHHRDEVFLPLDGLYLYPWQSQYDDGFSFTGFDEFVTAGCLFGASIKGKDPKGYYTPLIKHDLEFSGEQKIVHIDFNDRVNPYEKMWLKEFVQYANLIQKFSAQKPPKLRYHLPFLDYVLFGVELFIRGRMTFNALAKLIDYIFKKKNEHINLINNICEEHGIEVIIESPFANLFGPLETSGKSSYSAHQLAHQILEKLNVSSDEVDPRKIQETTQKENEANLVKYCLEKLQSNSYKPEYAAAWKDFINLVGEEHINNLEDLFKIANSIVLSVSASGKAKHKTCSLLPVSEKPIQVSYDAFRKPSNLAKTIGELQAEIKNLNDTIVNLNKDLACKDAEMQNIMQQLNTPGKKEDLFDKMKSCWNEKEALIQQINEQTTKLEKLKDRNNKRIASIQALGEKYPAVFNLTVMDQFIPYEHKNNGQMFYIHDRPVAISELITKGILENAHKNAARRAYCNHGLFGKRVNLEPTLKLETFLHGESEKPGMRNS